MDFSSPNRGGVCYLGFGLVFLIEWFTSFGYLFLLMRKLSSFLFLCSSLVVSHAEEKSLAVFDQIVKEMNQRYFDPTFSGLEWGKLCREARQKIDKAPTEREGYAHINALLGNFKHSHMAFYPALDDVEAPRTGYHKQIDFSLKVVEGKWAVASVKKESDAWKAGLRKGFVIESIGGKKEDLLKPEDGVEAYYEMKSLLDYYPTRELVLGVVDDEGKAREIEVKLSRYQGQKDSFGNMASGFEVRTEKYEKEIGYVGFSIFMFKPVLKVIQEIKSMKKAGVKAVIIDVRGNPGGTAMLATAIAKEFCQKDYVLGTMQQREENLRFPVIAQAKPFAVPVVILTDISSASTAEVLAGGMQAEGVATVIGSTSAGAVLPSFIIELEGGGQFQFPIADFKTPDGRSLEGVGVKPDIVVKDSLESLREGKDLALEKAIEFLNRELAKP